MSFHANFLKTNVYYYYSISINSCNYHKRTSFKSFHPNFLENQCLSLLVRVIYQIYKINTCNYHKKSSLNSFQAYFFKTNVYHYSRHSSIKYIQYIHATTSKKLLSRLFMLISRKPMFITTS